MLDSIEEEKVRKLISKEDLQLQLDNRKATLRASLEAKSIEIKNSKDDREHKQKNDERKLLYTTYDSDIKALRDLVEGI